jgi:hypothetical protein
MQGSKKNPHKRNCIYSSSFEWNLLFAGSCFAAFVSFRSSESCVTAAGVLDRRVRFGTTRCAGEFIGN